MAQDNPFDQFDTPTAAPARAPRPLRGAPPKPDKPNEPKTTYRTLEPDEVKARGLDPTVVYQISSEGNVSAVSGQKNSDKPTEYQSKSNQFYGRMLAAEKQYRDTPEDSRDARTVTGQWLHDTFPGVDATFNSSGRNSSDNAARNWIAASLRQESGAAISTQEYDNQYRIFFPMPGDGPDQIKQKAEARKQAMMGFRTSSGPLAEEADKQYNAQYGPGMPWDEQGGGTAPGAPGGDAPPPGGGQNTMPIIPGGLPVGSGLVAGDDPDKQWWDRDSWLKSKHGITQDQENLIVSFWNSNARDPALSVGSARAWYQQNGLPVPNDAELQLAVDKARNGARTVGYDDSKDRAAYRSRLEEINNAYSKSTQFGAEEYDPNSSGSKLDRFTEAPLLGGSDEIAGVSGAIVAGLTGGDMGDEYRLQRDASALRNQQMEQSQGATGAALEFVGSLPAAALGPAGEYGTVRQAIVGGAKAGAVTGAVVGFNEGRGVQGSLGDAVKGGSIGGVLGGALGGGVQKLANRTGGGVTQNATATMSSAQKQELGQKFGIDLGLGDTGGMGAKAVERVLDVQPGSASVMNKSRATKSDQIVRAVDDVAETFGPETSFRGIGDAAQTGARKWIDKFNRVSAKAYDAIPINPQSAAETANTVGRLQELTGKFSSNPKLAGMLKDSKLVGYLDALTAKAKRVPTGLVDEAGAPITREVVDGGGISWTDLKDLRSRIGEEIGQQMFGEGSLKSDLRSLYAALSDDMRGTAMKSGESALKAFDRANTLYRQGQERIDGAVTRLLGKDGAQNPEKTAAFIQSITRGGKSNSDIAALREVRATMQPDEWGQIQNGIVRLMGQPANSEGREFSAQTFIKVFGDMAPDAKNIVFGNSALRKNLDELSDVINMVAKSDGTRNVSNTGMALSGLIGASQGLPALVLQTLGSFGTAKLWTNPVFVKWASKTLGTSRTAPRSIGKQIDKLAKIAAANDNIAPDAQVLIDRLTESFAQSPVRAAASDKEQDRRRVPPGQ